uniref:Uncharacterized protein n=1 Tax=Plectus sambesii TaxID=2011161 RepID=A0A914X0H9_9BILA
MTPIGASVVGRASELACALVDRDVRRRRWKVNRGQRRGDGVDGSYPLPVRPSINSPLHSTLECPFYVACVSGGVYCERFASSPLAGETKVPTPPPPTAVLAGIGGGNSGRL